MAVYRAEMSVTLRVKPRPKLVVRSVAKMRRLNALLISEFIPNFPVDFFFYNCEPIFGHFGLNHLKQRFRLNHVPVHKMHSAKVTKMLTTSSSHGLTLIECTASLC